jgi:membrane AbrB-like protein
MTGGAWREGLLRLGGGAAGAGVLTALGVPAGGIIGAVLGSAAVSGARGVPLSPKPVRVVGLVLLGAAAGLRLDATTLGHLRSVALPLALAVLALLLAQGLLALVLCRWFRLDPVTALLAAAPGGVSEIASIADEVGARVGVVTAIHVVRVVVVVLAVLPLLMHLLG